MPGTGGSCPGTRGHLLAALMLCGLTLSPQPAPHTPLLQGPTGAGSRCFLSDGFLPKPLGWAPLASAPARPLIRPPGPEGLGGLGSHVPASHSTGATRTLCLVFRVTDRHHCDLPWGAGATPFSPLQGRCPAPHPLLAVAKPLPLRLPIPQAHSPQPLLPGY